MSEAILCLPMDVDRQGIILEYEDIGAAELPQEMLYDMVLLAEHGIEGDTRRTVEDALHAVAGDAQARRVPWLGPDLRFRKGAFNLDVRLRNSTLRVEALNRLQPRSVERVVGAVARLPGVRGLRIEATVPHFSKGLSNLRACTPCQAASLR